MDINNLLALEQIALMDAQVAGSDEERLVYEELAISYGKRVRAIAFRKTPAPAND